MGYLLLFVVLRDENYIVTLKKIIMKNSFKLAVLALAIATSFAACKGKGAAGADSAKTDSVKTDSTKMVDTAKADTGKMKMADTTKKKM
jgi:hypothetical protein